jgi:hypothetical protein
MNWIFSWQISGGGIFWRKKLMVDGELFYAVLWAFLKVILGKWVCCGWYFVVKFVVECVVKLVL